MSIYISADWNHSERWSRVPKEVVDTPIDIYIGDEMEVTLINIDERGEIKVTSKDTNETIET